jgi:nucleoside-diphosphate-sugar epimerase
LPRAFIVGGTGQIGLATASRLIEEGWSVTLAHRGLRQRSADLIRRGVRFVPLDRNQPGALARALSNGTDLLVDAVAYEPKHGRQLLDVQGSVGAMVVVSSSSVYRDERGRTLDEAAETGFPELPDPMTEQQLTVAPGPGTYSTRKVALERVLLDNARTSLTILRPAAISGPGSSHAREWWFVKRMLDRRPFIPLAYGGQSRFHSTSAANIAALAHLVATLPGQRVLNIADPSCPTVSEIASRIGKHLGYKGEIVELPVVDVYPPALGRTPWSTQRPFVLDISAAADLGYRPRTTYMVTAATVSDWLVEATKGRDWRSLLPTLASYPFDLFDYSAEDQAQPLL